MIIRPITPQERVSQFSAYGDLTTCGKCDQVADFVIEGEHGRLPVCYEHRQLEVTAVECWFYSRRSDLLQRGLGFSEAHRRAIALARYLEDRRNGRGR